MAASTRPIAKVQKTKEPSQSKPAEVFETNILQLFTVRIVRDQITKSFIDDLHHPVVNKERRLIYQSVGRVKNHLVSTTRSWESIPFRLRKMIIIRHIRDLARRRLAEYIEKDDLDEAVAHGVLENIFKMDFEEIFPSIWMDD
jgi:hypothetical protein